MRDNLILFLFSLPFFSTIFVVLQPYIFLGFFTTLVTMAAPHLKFSTCVSPSIILTQQSFWSSKNCALGIKGMVWDKRSQDWWFLHFNFMFGYYNMFKWAYISRTDRRRKTNQAPLEKKSIWLSIMGENWVLRFLLLKWQGQQS